MLGWFTKHRRQKIIQSPFPSTWEAIVRRNVAYFSLLTPEEQSRLRDLIKVFIAEKEWVGCGGIDLTDEMQVTIAAMACLLILNISHDFYGNVETILVYPEDVVLPERPIGFFETVTSPLEPIGPITGQAFEQGPLILVWDAVLQSIEEAGSGYNVVYHEFAHKLDMQDGIADGTPPLSNKIKYQDWAKTFSREYSKLLKDVAKGKRTFLDEYGATDETEFFAVATEHFFDQPVQMAKAVPDLYRILKDFYKQDPARRTDAFFKQKGMK
jgi:Mlc titration factor MtfA (ptsG expression regulator)